MRADFARWYQTPFFRAVARVLILLLMIQHCPASRLGASPAEAADGILWVDDRGDCGGKAPCYAKIQAAIDAALAGQTVRVLPGEYAEQLRVSRKNPSATAESERIVIEADPESPIGAAILRGAKDHCQHGYAIDFSRSKLVTIRGLTIAGAGFRGIRLRGGSRQNHGIRLERNRLFRGTSAGCMGGIEVERGNPDTVIANNVLQGLDRHALRFRHGQSGDALVVGNTIVRNGWNGIYLGRIADVRIWNNIIAFNGAARGGRGGGKFGVRRQKVTKPRAADVELRNNLICGNTAGEIDGPALDANDADNLTPTGREGAGVIASSGCDALATVFASLAGSDGTLDTADDAFGLAAGSPAIGGGLDPRLQGTSVSNAVFEADYLRQGARPGDAHFNVGAVEDGSPVAPTPTITLPRSPTPSTTQTPGVIPPSPSPTPSSSQIPTPSAATPSGGPTPGGGNQRPLAREDAYELEVATTLQVPAGGVLANDEDLDGDAMTAELVDPPTLGSLTAFNPDGSFTYQAPANFVQPALNPGVLWRIVTGTSGFGQVADFNRDSFPDLAFIEFGQIYGHDGRNGNRIFQVDFTDTSHVDVSGCTLGAAASASLAIGDVDDSGDVAIVKPLSCNSDFGPNRFVAINASQITAGKIGPLWVTENLSVPHPGAYASASDPAPANPPIRTQAFVTERSHPSLARLTPSGGVKVLARKLLRGIDGQYLGLLPNGTLGGLQAGCRAVTGLPADEHQACRITWILDAATGAVEHVLTAPNPTNDYNLPQDRPLSNNMPIAADLDGDGDVEIISGSDVFTQDGGVWTLAWQTYFEPLSVAVADLDGDGTQEVIQYQPNLFGRQPPESGIFIYRHDGTLVRRIPPVNDGGLLIGFLSVGDGDGDGAPDILFPAGGYLYAFRADGRLLWVFAIPDRPETLNGLVPAPVSAQSRTGETSAQVYDLDLDGRPEVIMHAGARLWILDGATGGEKWSMDTEGYGTGNRPLALADMDQDGHVDIVATGSNRWNCSTITGGPVPCLGNTLVVSGLDHTWAPGPKVYNQITFNPDQVDDDAKILFSTAPRRDYRMAEQQGTVVDPRLREGTKFTYTANDTSASSDPATVFLKIRPDNSPPDITSLPPTGLRSITPYTRPVYQITAIDPDPGDVLHYEFVSTTHFLGGKTETTVSATGVSVHPDTGAVSFYTGPCGSFGGGCNLGDVIVVVAAIDALGLRDEQSFLVTIHSGAATVPDVVGQAQTTAFDTVVNAGFRARVVLETFDAAPAGTVIAQTPAGGTTSVALGTSIDLSISKGPQPTPTPLPTASRTPDPDATVTPIPEVASIVVEPASQILLVNETQAYTATGVFADGTSVDLTTSVAWDSSNGGAASMSGPVASGVGAGATTISATLGAVTGQAALTVVARFGEDTPPTATITSPAAQAEVTEPVDVVGTADDDHFLKYELAIAPAGEPDEAFTIIATGAAPVVNGVLGRLDPTLLINDQYTIRLTVFDRGDNQTTAEVVVQIARNMKIGQFTLSFEDVAVPVTGLPLGIERTYDSRDKRQGDFGVGWRLDLNSLRIRTNRVLGTGWVRNVQGPNVVLFETDVHRVTVTLPGNFVERFDLKVSPTANLGSLDFTNVTGFEPVPGTLGTLASLENPGLLIFAAGQDDVLTDDLSLEIYDPQLFRYTTVDGTQVDLHRKEGVKRIADTNGNTVTFGPTGIVHSAGAAVTLTRDAENRITQIVDPSGASQTYAYDANGDLRSHTDPSGATTEFFYDRRHNLLRIVDPLGRPVARNEYDDTGRLIATTDAKGNRTEVTHDLNGRREIMRDPLGRFTTLDYDARGNVVASTDPLGHTTTFTYDAADNRLTETDPLGRTTTRTWDAKRNELSVTDPLGHTTARTYGARERVLTKTDALGRTTSQTLDANANPLTRVDALGRTETLAYGGGGNVASVTDVLGRVTGLQYDALGRRTGITRPDGTSVTIVNDAAGRVLSETGTGGATQALAYDVMGRPTAIGEAGSSRTLGYDAAGRLTEATTKTGAAMTYVHEETGRPAEIRRDDGSLAAAFTYDALGNVLTHVGPTGGVTRYAYDGADRLTATTFPDGGVEQRSYDPAGQLVAVTDALGNTTTYEYDAAGRRIRTIDALGGVAINAYDAVGNVVTETDPLGRTTQYAYDAVDRLVTTTFPDGRTESRTYDASGRLTQIVDPAGHARAFTHDVTGDLASVTEELDHVTTYDVDQANHTTTIEDANGHQTVYAVDSQGRLISTTRPGGQTDTITYDAAGRVVTRTNANGELLTFAYDGTSALPSTLTLPGGATESYTWAPGGVIETATDARGTTMFDYDAATRRLRRVTDPDGSYVRYEYDLLGRRTLVAHAPNGGPEETTRYDYDPLGRLVEVVDSAGGMTTYTRDAVGQETVVERPNGTVTETSHDARGRVTAIVHRDPLGGVLESFTYTLDALGNRSVETRADGSRVEYTYDAASRLVAERRFAPGGAAAGEITYTYDPVGNLVARGGDLGSATFSYDANDQLLSGAGVVYTYDAAGNRTSAGLGAGQLTHFRFDARGRLVRIEPPAGDPTDYAYDLDGTRLASEGPSGNVDFLVDRASPTELTQVLRESDNGQTLRSYVYGTTMLGESEAGATAYRHTDALGSTRLLTDDSGVETDAYDYSGYGNLLAHAGASSGRYRFTGEPQDPESGLYHLRARYYDPEIGRFVSRDPAGGDLTDPRSLNDYAYAHGNPTNLTDPSGRSVPTSLGELLGVLRTQAEIRYHQLDNFIKTEKRVADVSGDVLQRIGAAFSVVALLEEIDNPKPVRTFFGNLVPGGKLLGGVVGGLAGNIAAMSYQAIASFRLGQTAFAMIGESMLYKVDDFTACKNEYFAVAVQGAGTRHIELCPSFIGLDNLPRNRAAVFGRSTDASKMGVMVHEWTHITFRAKDDYYLCSRARTIAGASAVDNADNYRCWVELSTFSAGDAIWNTVFGD